MTAPLKRIFTTRAYELFERDFRNRIVRENKRYHELETSMIEFGWLDQFPLYATTNGKGILKIVDGHRRLTIAKKLGIVVKYTIGPNIPIWRLQVSDDQWTMEDFLNYYVKAGNENYIKVKNYRERSGIGLSNCIQLLGSVQTKASGGCDTTMIENFKKGEFVLGNPAHAEEVAMLVAYFNEVCSFSFSTNRSFVTAISKILHTGIDTNILKQKMKRFKTRMEKQPSLMHYVQNIEDVYNLGNRKPSNITFEVKQLGK